MTNNYFHCKHDAHQLIFFALGFWVKFTKNDLVLEGVDVWTSKTFGKGEENINLPFLRSLNGILLLDIKQSLISFFLLILLYEAAQHSQNLLILGLAPSLVWAKADIVARFLEK